MLQEEYNLLVSERMLGNWYEAEAVHGVLVEYKLLGVQT